MSIFMNGWMGAWGSGFGLIWGRRDFEGAGARGRFRWLRTATRRQY